MNDDITPEQQADAQAKVNKGVEDARRIADEHIQDLSPASIAALVGAMGPSASDLVGASLEDIANAKHSCYVAIFRELLPVHTALIELTDRSTADHVVTDIFMNTLAVTMMRFGEPVV
jgi:hypothetical protein